jgi:hypothetical protein
VSGAKIAQLNAVAVRGSRDLSAVSGAGFGTIIIKRSAPQSGAAVRPPTPHVRRTCTPRLTHPLAPALSPQRPQRLDLRPQSLQAGNSKKSQ